MSDLGLRVFERDEWGDWFAPYIGRASFDENTGEWLALIPTGFGWWRTLLAAPDPDARRV